MKTYAIITIILSIFLLTACNSEPSDKDIYNAFKSVVDRTNASMKDFDSRVSEKDLLKIDYVKKVSCSEEANNVYNCIVDASISNMKQTKPVKLVKSDGVWKEIQQ
ncbi:cell wall-binding protein [Salmonella enterica subsp. enterica serovar Stanleyville]|uniref:cell wall-binding protein n=1 Tax=Salmonella enterica TaxID=28901 RepID=UPI0008AA6780|nr:cell wall-binding protein [Salmonella enterica]EBQ9566651.1 cell wall-binding protein [Salmonella enterica subsp. enterica serovar Stanleyville]AOZ27522.1 cell wall-binding protein [Salmonella enterica subsp. enterica serovar Saintpaul str. SARA26]EBS3859857.1 cell wall-binding protein [Salmonella enterica subsp. enterica serovar Stanleyville]EBV1476591.1 cell wall-binding protein [Salmonella enterica subsp. enterica serovar Stanleyville]EBW9555757.1 cell wall-binding protein [Salmonella en